MTQPPVGQPLPCSGQPQPSGPGGDYPPALPPVTPVMRGNAFAIAGIVLGIVIWPLGLLFSIIGLVKSKARAGSGKILSIVGIVVSLVSAATFIGFAVVVYNSMVGDPGCVAENDFDAMTNKFSADGNALIHDEGDSSAERAAAQHFIGDAQALRSELNVAAAEAQHQSIRAKIGIMTSDLGAITSSLQTVSYGDASQIGQVFISLSRVTEEATSLIPLCPPAQLSVAHPALGQRSAPSAPRDENRDQPARGP